MTEPEQLAQQLQILQRKADREKAGRLHAEQLLEDKARELYQLNQELKDAYQSLQAQERQLIQHEKMASIGQLAAGIAHEINTPTGYAASNIQMLEQYINNLMAFHQDLLDLIPEQQVNRYIALKTRYDVDYLYGDLPGLIKDALTGLHRIKSIVSDLREFSHLDTQQKEWLNVNRLIEQTLHLAANQLKYHVQIHLDLQCSCDLLGYPGKLGQVLLNLLVNAGQAIKQQGNIYISTHCQGQWLLIAICDDGDGIAEEHLTQIFNPFFTTKPVGIGTGLGLSISHDIVEQHGGTISVASELGVGTTFTLRLPLNGQLEAT